MAGQLPISFSEIEAWSRLTGRSVSPFEVDLIKDLDFELLAHWAATKPKG